MTIADFSQTYGQVVWRRLGTIDIRQMPSVDWMMKWTDKYHPRTYFGSSMSRDHIKDDRFKHLHESVVGWDVWVPAAEDNKDWKPDPTTSYGKSVPKAKKLPIGISEKKIQKWLEASEPLLVK